MRAQLNDRLPEPNYCRVQVRAEAGLILEEGRLHSIVPDLTVLERRDRLREASDRGVLTAPRVEVTPGVEVRIHTDPVRHPFLEIRDAARGHRVITVIEIVSPSNKRPGPTAGPTRPSSKRSSRATPASSRSISPWGRRLLPYPELDAATHALRCDYLVISTGGAAWGPGWTTRSSWAIQGAVARIPIPLAGEDPDVPLTCRWRKARRIAPALTRLLDYTAPPQPPVQEDEAWADARCARPAAAAPAG
jgi:hypothetical protein